MAMNSAAIAFYCGINDTAWNHHPVAPGALACISPVYGKSERTRRENRVDVPNDVCAVIQDSGAFCDGPAHRLDFTAALERQMQHAEKWGYADRITHRASYDLLIDEKWVNGRRHKARWSEAEAAAAVDETVAAAVFAAQHRSDDDVGLVLSAQGVTARQYLACVQRIVPLMNPTRDILGLGGWCVAGRMPARTMPVFYDTMRYVIPYAARHGVERAHIWGVIYADALGSLLWICDQHHIRLSTDSAGPQLRPVLGEWGYAEWKLDGYKAPPVETRGSVRAWHVRLTRSWLAQFRSTIWYRNNLLKRYDEAMRIW